MAAVFHPDIQRDAQNSQRQLRGGVGRPDAIQSPEQGQCPKGNGEEQARLDIDQQGGDVGLFDRVKIGADAAGDADHQEGAGGDDQSGLRLLCQTAGQAEQGCDLRAQQRDAHSGQERNNDRGADGLFKQEANVLGLARTVVEAQQWLDAGADACFITFPGSIRGMKEWRHRIHGPVVTTPIKYEDSIDQETEAGACMSVYWPNTIYAAFTAVRDTLKKFAETRDMTKVDAKFDEDELLKLLPLQKYYDQMDKYHGEKQYLK